MPNRCVVGGCSNYPNVENGIVLHKIPFEDDAYGPRKKRRKRWIDFVKLKRAKWNPTANSCICSNHFSEDDYERFFHVTPEKGKCIPRLKTDEYGIVAIPRFHQRNPGCDHANMNTQQLTQRSHRQVLKDILATEQINSQPLDPLPMQEEAFRKKDIAIQTEDRILRETCTQTKDCTGCIKLWSKCRQLSNKIIDLTAKLKKKKSISCGVQCELLIEQACPFATSPQEFDSNLVEEDRDAPDDCQCSSDDEEIDGIKSSDLNYEIETEDESDDEEESEDPQGSRVWVKDSNLRNEPKFVVFLSQLLLLFKFCHHCKADNALVEARQHGTMIIVSTSCINPHCQKKETVWRSQPTMSGTVVAAGNFLLCFAILLAGGSASKVFQIFDHMGLACISLKTFFKHQRERIFPTILIHWKKYQTNVLAEVKASRNEVVMSGDGRHDSMGHSAKFGAYTIFCCSVSKIIYFSLVQRNQAGSSTAMEYMGFQNAMAYLQGSALPISAFVSDRHTSIAKHMREKLPNIKHYFDLWHLKKKITKVLTKISKERGMEELADWIRPCERHLYWSATSTFSGNGLVIWAKFKSFLSHVINKHETTDNPLFSKCAHGEIKERKWLTEDSLVYEKLNDALTNSRLISGIKQASPLAQTSCLEGFHSVLNHFAPKMIAYTYAGMFCRHAIAVIHFNMNLFRKPRSNNGSTQIKVTYPKFKNGLAKVRDVKVKQTFTYVEDIYQTFLDGNAKNLLQDASKELKIMEPAPMSSDMLEKECKRTAIKKMEERKKMVATDVPPTTPVNEVLEMQAQQVLENQALRSKPHCGTCKKPMKGHKHVLDCPKNRL